MNLFIFYKGAFYRHFFCTYRCLSMPSCFSFSSLSSRLYSSWYTTRLSWPNHLGPDPTEKKHSVCQVSSCIVVCQSLRFMSAGWSASALYFRRQILSSIMWSSSIGYSVWFISRLSASSTTPLKDSNASRGVLTSRLSASSTDAPPYSSANLGVLTSRLSASSTSNRFW
jgi:hypothetical protein